MGKHVIYTVADLTVIMYQHVFLLPVTELPAKSGFKYVFFLSQMNTVEVGGSQAGSKDE